MEVKQQENVRFLITVQTPYDGGVFRIKLILGEDYPQTPPKGHSPSPLTPHRPFINILKFLREIFQDSF